MAFLFLFCFHLIYHPSSLFTPFFPPFLPHNALAALQHAGLLKQNIEQNMQIIIFSFFISCHISNLTLILLFTVTLQYCTFLSAFTTHCTMPPSTLNWCLGAWPTHCFQGNLLHILEQQPHPINHLLAV